METEKRTAPAATRGPSSDAKWIIGILAPLMLGIGGLLWSQNNAISGAINSRLDRIETDLRRMDDRLRAIEIGFAQIEQRLSTLERLHLPSVAHPRGSTTPRPEKVDTLRRRRRDRTTNAARQTPFSRGSSAVSSSR